MDRFAIIDLTKEEFYACKAFLEEERKKKKKEEAIKECRNYLEEIVAADIDAIGLKATHEILEDIFYKVEDLLMS